MEKRLQQVNGDTVLEITDTVPVKTRHSEKDLLSRKQYLATMIAKCTAGLAEVNARLAEIEYERGK